MVLSKLPLNKKAVIISIGTTTATKSRLKKMGLTEGSEVMLIRFSPFGDAVEIKLKGFYLALRTTDADKIEVNKFE